MLNSFKKDMCIVRPKINPQAKLRLFCLPFAGGGSTAFRTWPNNLPNTVEVCAVEIPGRGQRLSEPLIRKIDPLVKQIAEGIIPYLDRPFALFGHSMGSLLGFELSHFLLSDCNLKPVHLFMSGRGAPFMPDREKPIHKLSEKDFVQKIRNYNGTPKEVLEHEELMEIMIPILRADFEVCETYIFKEKQPLDCPLTVFGGLQDSGANKEELKAWEKLTTGPFALRMFPGDHFYLLESQVTLIKTIAHDINTHFNLNSQ